MIIVLKSEYTEVKLSLHNCISLRSLRKQSYIYTSMEENL